MALNSKTVLCKKLGKIFESMPRHKYELVEFTRNILKSEFKSGLEKEYPIYYSQGIEYYFECFEEWFPNMAKADILYNKESLFWMGYLFQHWFYNIGITGVELEKQLSDNQIRKLYSLWDIYHTQDLEWVYEDIMKNK